MGQEALAVALAAELEPTDYVTATYRGHSMAPCTRHDTHGTCSPRSWARRRASTGGVGGSMHVSEMELGLLPTFAIVGARSPGRGRARRSPSSTGRSRGSRSPWFGDGATNIGAFHESLNLARDLEAPDRVPLRQQRLTASSRTNLTTPPIEDLHLRAGSLARWRATCSTDGCRHEPPRDRGGRRPRLQRRRPDLSLEAKTYRFAGTRAPTPRRTARRASSSTGRGATR